MDGVYGDSIYETPEPTENGEQTVDTGKKSYYETINEIADLINRNLAFMDNFVEGLKYDQNVYVQYKREFNNIVAQYRNDLQVARTTGETSPDDVKKTCVKNLLVSLDYTDQIVKKFQDQQQAARVTQESQPTQFTSVSQPAAPITDMSRTIAKVTGSQSLGALQPEIQMVNVGPIRAWWDNLGDSTKTMIKVGGVAALVFLVNFGIKKWKESKTTVPEVEEE